MTPNEKRPALEQDRAHSTRYAAAGQSDTTKDTNRVVALSDALTRRNAARAERVRSACASGPYSEIHDSSTFDFGRMTVMRCDRCGDTLILVGDGGIHFATWPQAAEWLVKELTQRGPQACAARVAT